VSLRQLAKENGVSHIAIYKTISRAKARLLAIASRSNSASAA
jgi:predicted DNA binding protein